MAVSWKNTFARNLAVFGRCKNCNLTTGSLDGLCEGCSIPPSREFRWFYDPSKRDEYLPAESKLKPPIAHVMTVEEVIALAKRIAARPGKPAKAWGWSGGTL